MDSMLIKRARKVGLRIEHNRRQARWRLIDIASETEIHPQGVLADNPLLESGTPSPETLERLVFGEIYARERAKFEDKWEEVK